MTSGLLNTKYYRGTFFEIQKFMEVREEGMEVQEETILSLTCCLNLPTKLPFRPKWPLATSIVIL